jgi:hypothetical protein
MNPYIEASLNGYIESAHLIIFEYEKLPDYYEDVIAVRVSGREREISELRECREDPDCDFGHDRELLLNRRIGELTAYRKVAYFLKNDPAPALVQSIFKQDLEYMEKINV